jgi:hypothetical protein
VDPEPSLVKGFAELATSFCCGGYCPKEGAAHAGIFKDFNTCVVSKENRYKRVSTE